MVKIMMKKLHATLSAISVFALAMGSIAPAFAGEGGAAGAAVFHLNSAGKVTDSAVSGAVGKSNAAATAFSVTKDCFCDGSTLSATAFGSAGKLEATIDQNGTSAKIKYEGGEDKYPGINKENSATSGSIVNEVGKGVVSF
jgi:hypothetical protein